MVHQIGRLLEVRVFLNMSFSLLDLGVTKTPTAALGIKEVVVTEGKG